MTSSQPQVAALQLPPTLSDEPLDPTLTALSTLSLLNLRLSRLEFLLTGSSTPSTTSEPSSQPTGPSNIPTQLHHLESRLTNLKRLDGLPGTLVRMVDNLRREYPELFPQNSSTITTSDQEPAKPASVTELSQQSTQVLANSTLYTSTSAHLQTLSTLRIPPAEHSANLVDTAPRLAKLKERQEKLDAEIEELRGRSAGVVEWWVKNGVVGMGELWDDWEERVRGCERVVRRKERRRREERGEVG